MQLATYHEGRISFFDLSGMLGGLGQKLGKELFVSGDSVSKGDAQEQELLRRYESEDITAAQYVKEMGILARRKKQYYANRVEQVGNEITRLHGKLPFAFGMKPFMPIIQIIGVILVILTNVSNLRQADG